VLVTGIATGYDDVEGTARKLTPHPAVAPDRAVFIASMAVYGVCLGAVDATTNMQAVALEHLYDRPILPLWFRLGTAG
jgi:hypothetical protein